MNSYEFTVRLHRLGIIITGHIGGSPPLPGVPALLPLPSTSESVLLFKLIYHPFTQHHATGFDEVIRNPPANLRAIRILLPSYQEFILCSKANRDPLHPVARTVTDFSPATWDEPPGQGSSVQPS